MYQELTGYSARASSGRQTGRRLPIKCAPEGLWEKATVSGKGKGFALGLGFYCLFKQFLLKYSRFTVLCLFLLYSKVNRLYVCVCSVACRVQLGDPVDCTLPGSSVHGIFQARILECVAMPSSRDLPDSGIEPGSLKPPALAGRFLGSPSVIHTYIRFHSLFPLHRFITGY